MAPRFTKEAIQALKRAMKARMPTCILTKEDYDRVITETGVSAQQIEDWEKNMRRNYKGEARVAFLDTDKDVVSTQCINCQ